MNRKFGRLVENKIEYAPSTLKIGNIFYSSPTDDQYLQMKYKFIVDNVLGQKDGFSIAFKGYAQDEQHIYINYEYIEIETPEQESFQISKLYLRIALMKLGIWDQIVEYMKSTKIMISEDQWINMYDAWNDALVIDTGSELFKPYLSNMKEVFKDFISPEQVDELLIQCKAK